MADYYVYQIENLEGAGNVATKTGRSASSSGEKQSEGRLALSARRARCCSVRS